jgi:hypothetical protein
MTLDELGMVMPCRGGEAENENLLCGVCAPDRGLSSSSENSSTVISVRPVKES